MYVVETDLVQFHTPVGVSIAGKLEVAFSTLLKRSLEM